MIDQLLQAFANVTLRDENGGWGTGLRESQGLDDYASEAELEAYRRQDEKLHWWKIPLEDLHHCHAGTWFMDVQGFVFHLPAFLTAELNDEHGYGFIERLIRLPEVPQGWSERLTPDQKKALVAALRLVVEHPDYAPDAEALRKKIDQLESTRRSR